MAVTNTLHVIFKTHLDLGFTARAGDVRRRYHDYYIPMALETGEHFLLENREAPEFIWTTGSWLIWDHLQTQSAEKVRRLENGIAAGIIAWHALPFTMHSEILSPALLDEGVSIARELDTRFGRSPTRAAKMTDVPGHTLGIVDVLAEAGVEFLHLGVNAASPVPDVPPIFRWQAPSGAELVVMYQNSYGAAMVPDGMQNGIAFAHTMDNAGPQDVSRVIESLDRLEQDHPGMMPRASTLDAFWSDLAPYRDRLPVVTSEIGDTWIHGTGSAPERMAKFRANQRLFEKMPSGARRSAFGRTLLEVAEHTWGVDVKTYLRDASAWDRRNFDLARKTDPRFSYVEGSWAEQDAILDRAQAQLTREETSTLDLPPSAPAIVPIETIQERIQLERFELTFDPQTGALRQVDEDGATRIAADCDGPGLFAYTQESYSAADIADYLDSYLTHPYRWGIRDHGKQGLATASSQRHAEFIASQPQIATQSDAVWIATSLPQDAVTDFGAPSRVLTGYSPTANGLAVTVHLIGKKANRQPEAGFLGFYPDGIDRLTLLKLGIAIDPCDVALNGNRQLHAVTSIAMHQAGQATCALDPLDSQLFNIGKQPFLIHAGELPSSITGGRFVLFNNKWGTNFSMWCEGDLAYRFLLRLGLDRKPAARA